MFYTILFYKYGVVHPPVKKGTGMRTYTPGRDRPDKGRGAE